MAEPVRDVVTGREPRVVQRGDVEGDANRAGGVGALAHDGQVPVPRDGRQRPPAQAYVGDDLDLAHRVVLIALMSSHRVFTVTSFELPRPDTLLPCLLNCSYSGLSAATGSKLIPASLSLPLTGAASLNSLPLT